MKKHTKFIINSSILTILPFFVFPIFNLGTEVASGNLYINILYYLKFDIFNLFWIVTITIPAISWIGAIILGMKARKLEKKIFSLILITLSSFFLAIYVLLPFIGLW